MAKNYMQGLMGQNERTVLVTRQHWFVLFSNILFEIILTVALVVVVIARRQLSLPSPPLAWFSCWFLSLGRCGTLSY